MVALCLHLQAEFVSGSGLFAFVAALIIQLGARRVLGSLYERDPTIETPSYLSRLSVAFWSTAIPSGAVGVFLATTYFFLNYFNVLRPDIAGLLQSLFVVLGIVFFISRLAFACISPYTPAWRLVPVAPRRSSSRLADYRHGID